MTLREKLATNIRTRREKLGMTQIEVGQAMGMAGQYARDFCSRLERGARGITLDRLDDLAKVLKTTPSALLK